MHVKKMEKSEIYDQSYFKTNFLKYISLAVFELKKLYKTYVTFFSFFDMHSLLLLFSKFYLVKNRPKIKNIRYAFTLLFILSNIFQCDTLIHTTVQNQVFLHELVVKE